jgi:hypothetical protein
MADYMEIGNIDGLYGRLAGRTIREPLKVVG